MSMLRRMGRFLLEDGASDDGGDSPASVMSQIFGEVEEVKPVLPTLW